MGEQSSHENERRPASRSKIGAALGAAMHTALAGVVPIAGAGAMMGPDQALAQSLKPEQQEKVGKLVGEARSKVRSVLQKATDYFSAFTSKGDQDSEMVKDYVSLFKAILESGKVPETTDAFMKEHLDRIFSEDNGISGFYGAWRGADAVFRGIERRMTLVPPGAEVTKARGSALRDEISIARKDLEKLSAQVAGVINQP